MRTRVTLAIFLVGALFLLPVAAHAATLSRPGNNLGLAAYWNFDENTGALAGDKSGNKNNGTLSGTTLPAWVNGKHGTALSFDGAAAYVTAPNSSSLSITASTTISAWFKIAGLQGGVQAIVSKWGGTNAYFLGYNDSTKKFRFYLSGPVSFDSSVVSVEDGKWHFVTATYDQSFVRVYLDGVLVSSQAATGAIVSNTQAVRIGRDNSGFGTAYFNGTIDDVRIYNRALSATEIAYLYTAGAAMVRAPNNLGLVGSWNFDEGVGTKAGDTSGNKNTGTLSGSTLPSWVQGKHGGALSFDGSSSYVDMGQPTPLNFERTNSFTISAWIKTSASVNQTIVSKRHGGGHGYELVFPSGNTSKIQFNITNTDTTNTIVVRSSGAVNTGQWKYVVATYDGSSSASGVKIYIDGVQDSATIVTDNLNSTIQNTDPFQVGARNSGIPFSGSIDDVRVYSRTLSAAEVAGLYSQGATQANASSVGLTNGSSLQSGLVGLWTFDGPDTTDKIYDRSGQGNNGYVFSAVSTSSMKTIGKLGQALQFNASGGGVRIADAASLDPTTVTISAWIYSIGNDPSATSERIVDKANSGTISQGGYRMQAFSAVNCGSASPEWGMQWYNGSAQLLCGPTIPSTTGTWTNLVFTHDGTTGRIYANGVLVNSLTTSYTSGNAFNLAIGNSDQVSRPFTGKIDDVRMYNRALSASEVAQLYLLGK